MIDHVKIAGSLFLGGILLLGCADRSEKYPWIYDLDSRADTQGKMVGYEFWAKW